MRRGSFAAGLLAVALAAALAGAMPAAHAGGVYMSPVEQRHEPGDVVTMIGYTSSYFASEIAPILAGTRQAPELTLFGSDSLQAMTTPLGVIGRPLVEATGHPGDFAYRSSIAVRLPRTIASGYYSARFIDRGVGDIMGGEFTVGIDLEPTAIYRGWAFNEPAIARLSDDQKISAYPMGATVGELRRGVRPATDAWLRQPVKWPLTVIELPTNALTPSPPEAPTTTIPVAPTTSAVTTSAAPPTIAPTTVAAPSVETRTVDQSTRDSSDLLAVIAVLASTAVVTSASVLLLRKRRTHSSASVTEADLSDPPRREPALVGSDTGLTRHD